MLKMYHTRNNTQGKCDYTLSSLLIKLHILSILHYYYFVFNFIYLPDIWNLLNSPSYTQFNSLSSVSLLI